MQPTPEIALTVVSLPSLAAAFTPIVYRLFGERTAYFVTAIVLVTLGLAMNLYLAGAHGTMPLEWIPPPGISLAFHVDGLALLVVFLASGVDVLILTYSGGYMHSEPGQARYYATLLASMGSMLGVTLAGDPVAPLVFQELTSLSPFVLIGHYTKEKASQYATRKSMLITVPGDLLMLAGFLLLVWASSQTGAIEGTTYSTPVLAEHADATREVPMASGLLTLVLVLVGFDVAMKSARVPSYAWLPNAMETPTPVSALLHPATMVKAGVYLVGRFRPLFPSEDAAVPGERTPISAMLDLLMITIATMPTVSVTGIKELLAYSTASHLDLIITAFSFINSYGAEVGAFHILNHTSFKVALFMVAGIITHKAETRNIDCLGGLRRHLPVTAIIAAVTSLSMAGFPPFNSFYPKELLFKSTYYATERMGSVAQTFPIVTVFGSVLMFLYLIKFASLSLDGEPDGLGHVHRPLVAMLVPPAAPGVLVPAILVQPDLFIEGLTGDVYGSVVPGEAHSFSVHFPIELTPHVIVSLITIVVGAAAFPFYDRIHDVINTALRGPVCANWWYDNSVEGLTTTSVAVTPKIQTDLLRTYATWGLFGFVAFMLDGYAAADASMPEFSTLSVLIPIVLVLFAAFVAASAVDIAPSHVTDVLTLFIVGFMVAIFYTLAGAPDLALTRLVVGTLVLVTFLLVLSRLLAFYGDAPDRFVPVRGGLLLLAVDGTVFLTVLLSTGTSPDPFLWEFFVARAGVPAEHGLFFVDYGGGSNIVNIILVDSRSIDTMGKTSVVVVASLVILTLTRMRTRGET